MREAIQNYTKGDLRAVWTKLTENVMEKKAAAHSEKKILKKVWKSLLKNVEEQEKSGRDGLKNDHNKIVFIELMRQKVGERITMLEIRKRDAFLKWRTHASKKM